MKTINKYLSTLMQSILLCGALLLSVSAHAAPDADEARLPLLMGEYLSVEYFNILDKTRSPITAGKYTGCRQHVDITFDINEKLIYMGVGNFHDDEMILSADLLLSNIKKLTGFNFVSSTAKIKAISRSEFSIEVEGKVLRYRHVGNFRHFLNRETIAGRYKDEQGRLYVFSEDGWADFPQERFRYQVYSDYVMSDYDNFYDPTGKTESHSYGFKLQNDTLQLFELGGPMGDIPEPNPFVTLRRVSETGVAP